MILSDGHEESKLCFQRDLCCCVNQIKKICLLTVDKTVYYIL